MNARETLLIRLIATVMWLGAHATPPLVAQTQASGTGSLHESYALLPGVRIFYVDSGGSGVPVVFLHAATGSSRVWENQIGAFTAAAYRFIAYDRRGWGRTVLNSDGPQPGTGADDLLGLLDHLGLERVHLVATAAGASVALDFALSFPERLRSIVVSNAVGGVQDPDYIELGRRIRPPQFDALPAEIRELGPAYRAADREGTKRWIELEKVSRPLGQVVTTQATRNRIAFSLLETIKVPTLLITGDADPYAPPPVLRLFAARIRNSESMIVPEAGHSVYWERPQAFNRAVMDFLGRH